MSYWPLDKSSYDVFVNEVKNTFGKINVKINYVDVFNSGFLLYSQRDPTPTITVNVNEQFLLKVMVRRFLKPTIEHEFTHMFGRGKWSSLTVNYPQIVPITLRKNISDILNDDIQLLINCSICVTQQKLANQYMDFEFEKMLYTLQNNNGLLRASVLIRLGYLSAVSQYINWQKPLNPIVSKIVTDFFDKTILDRAKNLFECVCSHDFTREIQVDLTALCLELDESITLQKNYLIERD
jgi:hypothetical protein